MKTFAKKIIDWYKLSKRDLPWRYTTDPYLIWLSEVILQQTRVAQGLPYYQRFVESYPTVFDLSNATEEDVMRHWQGLGYYSRARNLHQTARYIANELQGQFPKTYHELLKLKGVGTYTGAAIASFAYQEPVAVLDGNVFRVLSRIFGIETDILSNEGKKQFTELANLLLDQKRPSEFNQAIMEFGAIQCTPVSPDCLLCPFQNECVALQTGRISKLPVKNKKNKIKERFFNYLIIRFKDEVVLTQRKNKDIWHKLYEFYLVESESKLLSTIDEVLESYDFIDTKHIISVREPMQIYKHVLTHQRIKAQFWEVFVDKKIELPEGFGFYSMAQFEEVPKSVLITNYWNKNEK